MAFRLFFFFMAVFDHFHSPCYLSGAGFSLFAHHLFLSINLKEEKLLPLSLKIKKCVVCHMAFLEKSAISSRVDESMTTTTNSV